MDDQFGGAGMPLIPGTRVTADAGTVHASEARALTLGRQCSS